ncbi:MAG: hypothetical protein GC190_05775 [Alphaproteobacteria bacterium]|nr:hypothetical protein [Alphaproteobacteria bacterium]
MPPSANALELTLDFSRPGRKQTVLVLAPVVTYPVVNQPGPYRLGGADYSRVTNYLFIDPATGSSRWLFPGNEQTIASTDFVYNTDVPATVIPKEPAHAVLYDVQPKGATKFQLYVSKLDGSALTKLLDDLDGPASEVADAETISVRYAVAGRQMLAVFATADFRQLVVKDVTKESKK